MREIFVKVSDHFEVMEIINRKPAILYRADSAKLNLFTRRIESMLVIPFKEKHTDPMLYSGIKTFFEMLRIHVLAIDAYLNSRFDFDEETAFEDKTAFINLDEEEEVTASKRGAELIELPVLTCELISQSADPLSMMELSVKEWGNYRNEMNLLYNEICSTT